jgi:hypothetical protein
MTMTAEPTLVRRRTRSERTPEPANVASLRAMLTDEAYRADWPEIERAIDYHLTATTVEAA